MGIIILYTKIKSSPEVCFGLSTSIDMHIKSTQHTQESAVAGITSGQIKLGEWVKWRARHFGLCLTLTTKITEYKYPNVFVDEMLEGPFKYLHHTHRFVKKEAYTLMVDEFKFASPFGIVGKLVDILILNSYMQALLEKRNRHIKHYAESGEWKEFI